MGCFVNIFFIDSLVTDFCDCCISERHLQGHYYEDYRITILQRDDKLRFWIILHFCNFTRYFPIHVKMVGLCTILVMVVMYPCLLCWCLIWSCYYNIFLDSSIIPVVHVHCSQQTSNKDYFRIFINLCHHYSTIFLSLPAVVDVDEMDEYLNI